MKIPYPRVLIDGTLYKFTPKKFLAYLSLIMERNEMLHPLDYGASVTDVVNFSIATVQDAREISEYIKKKIEEETHARLVERGAEPSEPVQPETGGDEGPEARAEADPGGEQPAEATGSDSP